MTSVKKVNFVSVVDGWLLASVFVLLVVTMLLLLKLVSVEVKSGNEEAVTTLVIDLSMIVEATSSLTSLDGVGSVLPINGPSVVWSTVSKPSTVDWVSVRLSGLSDVVVLR